MKKRYIPPALIPHISSEALADDEWLAANDGVAKPKPDPYALDEEELRQFALTQAHEKAEEAARYNLECHGCGKVMPSTRVGQIRHGLNGAPDEILCLDCLTQPLPAPAMPPRCTNQRVRTNLLIWGRYLEGQSQREIAADLGLSQPTIHRRLATLKRQQQRQQQEGDSK